ncbi:MAG: phosphotransferase, partial [Pseudomonadota bacterium]
MRSSGRGNSARSAPHFQQTSSTFMGQIRCYFHKKGFYNNFDRDIMSPEQDIARLFDLGGKVLRVEPHGHGLINDTFVVTTETGNKAILQRINRRVFPKPELISKNLRTLLNHIQSRQTQNSPTGREWKMPVMFRTHEGKDFAIDGEDGFWRALSFIEGTRTFDTISDPKQAEEAGFALGRFHALVHDLDPAQLHETLPGFHNA